MPTSSSTTARAAAARAVEDGAVFARPTLARIIATLGPASESPEMVRRLALAGVSVFRLNFSHGDLDAHERRLRAVREVAAEIGQPLAVLGDLQGPKIRVGRMPDGGLTVEAGDEVLFRTAPGVEASSGGGVTVLPATYADLAADVFAGQRVLVNDGAIRMLAVDRRGDDPADALRCTVTVGGLITSKKGINLPDSRVRAPAITERDWECVDWAVRHGIDFLALSFVRRAEEVLELRRRLAGVCSVERREGSEGEGALIPVVAKIEKPQALEEIDAILDASDAIMVARGDLGVEMDIAQVPIVQKRLIEKADEWGKPCIVATQMLESMIESSSPTRAEATDVANAIFDGADAVMLSAETATGRHPALVVDTMRRIVGAAEMRLAELATEPSPPSRVIASKYRTAALAHGAWYVARDSGAVVVAVWSQKGGAARYLSQTGFHKPIIAYSSDPRQVRRMSLLRGVVALHAEPPKDGSLAAWNRRVDDDLVRRGWVRPGEPIVLMAGRPLGVQGATNTLAIHYVGSETSGFMQHG